MSKWGRRGTVVVRVYWTLILVWLAGSFATSISEQDWRTVVRDEAIALLIVGLLLLVLLSLRRRYRRRLDDSQSKH